MTENEKETGSESAHNRDSGDASPPAEESRASSDTQVAEGIDLKEKMYAKALTRIVEDLGFTNQKELKTFVSEAKEFKSAVKDDEEFKEVEAKALISEVRALRQEVDTLKPQAEKLSTMQNRSLYKEVENAARKAGVLDEAAGDLVAIVSPRVRWSSDSSEIEVLVPRKGSEEMLPIGSLEELMTEMKQKKGHLFKAKNKSGAGTQGSVSYSGKSAPRKRAPTVQEIALGRFISQE